MASLFSSPTLSHLLIPVFYLRAFLYIPFVILHTFFSSLLVITMVLLRVPRPVVDQVIGPYWCGLMVKFSGLVPLVEGLENIPQKRGFLYLFTHSSHLDVPLLFTVSPRSFRFGSKSSMFQIPVFGYAIRLSGTLPIHRKDSSKVMAVYKEAEKRVAQGEAFALAPEGKRREGRELLPFKAGPFVFAINAKMPLVPVVLCGVDQTLPKGKLLVNRDRWKCEVGVKFLPVVETKDLSLDDLESLKAQVRNQMLAEYEKMKPRFFEG